MLDDKGLTQEMQNPTHAGITIILLAVVIDVFGAGIPLMIILKMVGDSFGEVALLYLNAVAIVPFCYALLGRFGKAFSLGLWSFGVKRCLYSDMEGYVGKGVAYLKEALPPSVHSKRATITTVYFVAMVLWIYYLS